MSICDLQGNSISASQVTAKAVSAGKVNECPNGAAAVFPEGYGRKWTVGTDIVGTDDTILASPQDDELGLSFSINGDMRYFDEGAGGKPSMKAPTWGQWRNLAVPQSSVYATFGGQGYAASFGMYLQYTGAGNTNLAYFDMNGGVAYDVRINFELTTGNVLVRLFDKAATFDFDFKDGQPHTLICRAENNLSGRSGVGETFIDGVSLGLTPTITGLEPNSTTRLIFGSDDVYTRSYVGYPKFLTDDEVTALHAALIAE